MSWQNYEKHAEDKAAEAVGFFKGHPFRVAAAVAAAALVIFGLVQCAQSAEPPKLRLCTGGEKGNYYPAGVDIKQQAHGRVAIDVIPTNGSWENLEKVQRGECDAAIVQSDAYMLYQTKNPTAKLDLERTGTLYSEYAHLVCNKNSGIASVRDLKAGHVVMVGPNGGGSWVSWENWTKLSKNLAEVSTVPIGGPRALAKVRSGSDAHCMLFIAGLASQAMKDVDANSLDDKGSQAILLAAVNDGALDDLKDRKGNRVYRSESIPKGTYKNLQAGSMWGTNSVKTLALEATVVASVSYIDANAKAYDEFVVATTKAVKSIRDRMSSGR